MTLSHIYNRRETLIALNRKHDYTSRLADSKKTEQYYKLQLELKKQEAQAIAKRREDKEYSKNLNKGWNALKTYINNPLILNR